ncbi:MAG: acetate/propionate family kinase [Anaerolineaceae bacterium]
MNILVFNCGSSSQNYKLYQSNDFGMELVCKGKAHRVGVKGTEGSFIEHTLNDEVTRSTVAIPDHATAAGLIISFLEEHNLSVDAIGHRFVHGGELFQQSILLTKTTLSQLEKVLPLAPIHNPNSLSVIKVCLLRFPGKPETLTFDTAFHAGLPESAYTYAIPRDLVLNGSLRKYGFHGLSYKYVSEKAAAYLNQPLESLKLLACHLGTGGSSVCAIQGGRSLDTSMGYSPLAGLMMSTRSGDLDPGVILDMLAHEQSAAEISDLLNKKSGLLGVSGFSSDIRDLIRSAREDGNEFAQLAVEMYVSRLKKTIGSYLALLGGADALIFTDDIGLQNPYIREMTCNGLEWAGVMLDRERNDHAPLDQMSDVSQTGSRVHILVTPTDEEQVIASETALLMKEVTHG